MIGCNSERQQEAQDLTTFVSFSLVAKMQRSDGLLCTSGLWEGCYFIHTILLQIWDLGYLKSVSNNNAYQILCANKCSFNCLKYIKSTKRTADSSPVHETNTELLLTFYVLFCSIYTRENNSFCVLESFMEVW